MSTEAKREVGELLAGQVENLPESVQDALVCGCFAADLEVLGGITWAYRRDLGFHPPFEPHRDTSGHEWFAGLTCDHLYADCPNRLRAEASLKACGWWDLTGAGLDPDGDDVCGMCVHRHQSGRAA